MAYDSNREVVVLYSGYWWGLIPPHTWEWDGLTWTKVSETGPVRYGFGMAFDPLRNVTVLYGGYNDLVEEINLKTYSAPTWEYDGKEWKPIDLAGDAPLVGAPLVYDEGLKCIIRHGGAPAEPTATNIRNDTWKWDGVKWIKIAYGPVRVFHRLVYDTVRKRILLFGGIDKPGSAPGDTWEFDGTNWIQVSTEGPSGREWPGFVFDIARSVAVLFGGNQYHGFSPDTWLGDTWEWDGFQWREILSPGPGTTYLLDMAYDSRRGKTVVFRGAGGGTGTGTTLINLKPLQETWEYGLVTSGIPRRIWEGQ